MSPTMLLIPGSFSTPSSYQPLALALRARSHETFISTLLSATRRPGPTAPGMHEDASRVAADVQNLVDEGIEVVLVAHSYSGMVASQCVKGLTVGERSKENKKGGVVRIVYVAALVGREGEAVRDFFGVPSYKEAVERGDTYQVIDHAAFAPFCFVDLHEKKPAAALAAAALFTEQSASSSEQPLTWPGYAYVPTTYILTTRDVVVSPEAQRGFVDILRGVGQGGELRDVEVLEIDAGHCPNASCAQELAEMLGAIVGRI